MKRSWDIVVWLDPYEWRVGLYRAGRPEPFLTQLNMGPVSINRWWDNRITHKQVVRLAS